MNASELVLEISKIIYQQTVEIFVGKTAKTIFFYSVVYKKKFNYIFF